MPHDAMNAFTSVLTCLLGIAAIVAVTVAVCKQVYAPTVVLEIVSKQCWGDV